ncbi:MAG: hypothetical protein QF701_14885 [Nitrospinota bacterium]|jgi:hypothetical protein|nr:hypothetical protein [Nitrospinota bacterium]MDP7369502.1 hypothetical protein [Nitrospinota bacterium]MDP7662450.1 hypothetical protein [Nitrospinota bacterium]HJP13934.1 hypothetical protein [Nitrospinota bacterium]
MKPKRLQTFVVVAFAWVMWSKSLPMKQNAFGEILGQFSKSAALDVGMKGPLASISHPLTPP